MKGAYGKLISPLYIINIVFQSFISLVSPAALMLLASWLLDKYTSVGGWIYAVLVTLGVITGFVSMIRFIIRGMAALEALERQQEEKTAKKDQL